MRKTAFLVFLGATLICGSTASFASDLRLSGRVNHDEAKSKDRFERSDFSDQKADDGGGKIFLTARDPVQQPDWIGGQVYSDDAMVMTICRRGGFIGGRSVADLPTNTSSNLTLKGTVMANWKGSDALNRCVVKCIPFGPKGNFKFQHKGGGPSGFLERIGKNNEGFVQYRYWFAQTASDHASDIY